MRTPSWPMDIKQSAINDRHIYIASSNDRPNTHHHILMVTGNPGCIGYYQDYLAHLSNNLKTLDQFANVSIYGTSLKNFGGNQGAVVGLQGQIEYLESCLKGYIERQVLCDSTKSHKVIVIGHSVGAYIGLELIRRHREKTSKGLDGGFRIIGYLGLWPTVTHIERSKRGRRFGWLLRLRWFAILISLLAKLLVLILSKSALIWILRRAGFPENAADTTAKFLQADNAVHQALYMAGDEMREIKADRWTEDIWGSATPSLDYPHPKLAFCFGQDDHWVSDVHRDELIESRGDRGLDEKWRPKMMIDDTGIPHSFCIHHSSVVARRSAEWISEMITADS